MQTDSPTHPIRLRDWLLLAVILFSAGLMRFSQPGVVEFFHDEAMLSTLALEMASGERVPLTGIISSVGIPNPPQSVYVMALPFAIQPDPAFATAFVMALNVVGVGLLWLIAQRYLGRTVALIAGLTYAINPWAVLYSRKIWAQDYHTPFLLLAAALALYGFIEAPQRKRTPPRRLLNRWEWAQALCLPVMLFGMQIHFAAWLLLPVYAGLVWIGRERITRRAALVGLLLGVLVMLPYGAGLMHTLQADPTRISDAAARSEASDGLHLSGEPLLNLAYLATGLGLETWVAPQQQSDMLRQVPPSPVWVLIGVMAVIGAAVMMWRRVTRWLAAPVLLWALLPALAFVPVWTPVYPHYLIGSLPALALLAGVGTAWLAQIVPLDRTGRSIILAAYAVLLITQGIWWRGALRYLDDTAIEYPGFTTPLHDLQQVERALGETEDVVVISYGMAWDQHHESVVWPIMLYDTAACVRTVIGSGYAVLPDGPFAVLVAPDAPPDPVGGLYTTGDPLTIPTRPGGGVYEVHFHPAAPAWQDTPITPIAPQPYSSGAVLDGYHLGEQRLVLRWRLPQGERGRNYQYSGQLYDSEGRAITQADAPFWQGRHWCEGDTLITTVPISTTDEAAELRVSMYRLGGENGYIAADVLDAAGSPTGQWVSIPLRPAAAED